jgi:purine-binding chemotaxis protein CheW
MESPKVTDQNPTTSLFANEEKEEAMSDFFLFDLDGELYAVVVTDIDQVMKIPPVTTVPNAPTSIIGVFYLRGKVIVVLDLLKRMHLSRNRALVPNFLFIAHHQKNYFGILVDRTRTMVRVPTKQIIPLDSAFAARIPPRYAKGMFMYEEPTPEDHKKNNTDFMIRPASAETPPPEQKKIRPVLLLNIEEILNQNDLLGILPPQ